MRERLRRRKVILFAFCLGVASAAATVKAFYFYTGRAGVVEADAIGVPEAKNSIRHAYAAAMAYTILRTAGLPQTLADKLVIKLGYLNEYVEHYTKSHKDPTAEVYKDLFNNAGGIAAARFLETCPSAGLTPREAIRTLATRNALANLHTDARLPALPGGAEVRAAIRKFKADKDEITRTVQRRLQAETGAGLPGACNGVGA